MSARQTEKGDGDLSPSPPLAVLIVLFTHRGERLFAPSVLARFWKYSQKYFSTLHSSTANTEKMPNDHQRCFGDKRKTDRLFQLVRKKMIKLKNIHEINKNVCYNKSVPIKIFLKILKFHYTLSIFS